MDKNNEVEWPSTVTLNLDPLSHNRRNIVMIIRFVALCTATLLAVMALQDPSAHALSMQECSAKYKAAKDAGTLNGMKWAAQRARGRGCTPLAQ